MQLNVKECCQEGLVQEYSFVKLNTTSKYKISTKRGKISPGISYT